MKILFLILTTASFSLHCMDDVLIIGEKKYFSQYDERQSDGTEKLQIKDRQEEGEEGRWVAVPVAKRKPISVKESKAPHATAFLTTLLQVQEEYRTGKRMVNPGDVAGARLPIEKLFYSVKNFSVDGVTYDRHVIRRFAETKESSKSVKYCDSTNKLGPLVDVLQSITDNGATYIHNVTYTPRPSTDLNEKKSDK